MTKFIFDLDGTITKQQTLPLISKHFSVQDEIDNLTNKTAMSASFPPPPFFFIESFIKYVYILKKLPVDEIAQLLAGVELHQKVVDFIKKNKENCIIATINLECWIKQLLSKVDCCFYSSDGITEDNKIVKLTRILRNEKIVERFQSEGEKVVFIGSADGDIEAMRKADVSIASNLNRKMTQGALSVADYLVFSEEALCYQLNQLL